MFLESENCIYGNSKHAPLEHHSHHHEHEHEHSHKHTNKQVLKVSFFITFAAMFVEIIVGIIANSLALVSDGVHMLTHAFALALSFLAIVISQKKANLYKTYGYHRMEILAAFINGISIAIGVFWIVYESYARLMNPTPINIKLMLSIALFGLFINILTGVILMKGDSENLNIKSSILHMLTDAASSVVIIIGGAVIYYTNLYIIDTILALFMAIIIGKWSYGLIKDSVNILLESSPIKVDEVGRFVLENFKDIKEIHDLHISEITTKMYILTAHIVLDKENFVNFPNIAKEISHKLEHKFMIGHITLQPEFK